jgi:hypothetical protein
VEAPGERTPVSTANEGGPRRPECGVDDSVQFATAGVRLAGGAVTEGDQDAARRVLRGESTAEEELAAFLRELED